MSLMRQVENSSVELDEAKVRCGQMEEAATAAQREASKALTEKNKLSEELREASQALLKRGDDFSESVSVCVYIYIYIYMYVCTCMIVC